MKNYPDNEIFDIEEALLNRKTYAMKFAEFIMNLDLRKRAFVIGLCGEWGCKNTSLLKHTNMGIPEI